MELGTQAGRKRCWHSHVLIKLPFSASRQVRRRTFTPEPPCYHWSHAGEVRQILTARSQRRVSSGAYKRASTLQDWFFRSSRLASTLLAHFLSERNFHPRHRHDLLCPCCCPSAGLCCCSDRAHYPGRAFKLLQLLPKHRHWCAGG